MDQTQFDIEKEQYNLGYDKEIKRPYILDQTDAKMERLDSKEIIKRHIPEHGSVEEVPRKRRPQVVQDFGQDDDKDLRDI